MEKTQRRVGGLAGRKVVHEIRVNVVEGQDAGLERSRTEGASIAVGSAEDNELVLTDRMVSRYHLEITPSPHGILVRDLNSLNGTFVDSIRVGSGWVAPGGRIRVGETVLVVNEGTTHSISSEVALPVIPDLVAESEAMNAVVALVHKLAQSTVSVLIRGETGTGKEVISEAIHDLGPRRDAPFRVVDCGSLPAGLVASELFGHERGAFTGADQRHIGAFESAKGGTVFLDEIGELPMQVQPALLGVLERRIFRRVGGRDELSMDSRVIAATHRDLRKGVNDGSFRADLYYRLAAARIEIPPLRKRQEDIAPLVRHFVVKVLGSADPLPFNESTMAALETHPWAGNVRELRNVVEAALTLGSISLEGASTTTTTNVTKAASGTIQPYKQARSEVLDTFEKKYLKRLITQCEDNASEAARIAGLHRGYLLSLLRRHGLR